MADAVIGALRVLLGVDTAAFSGGLDDASSKLNKFGKELSSGLGKAAAAAGVALTAVATGVAVAVKHSINSMDEMNKLSQKIGIPVEKLSELKLAAELSDVSIETLARSMSKLSTAMVAAAAGGAGPAASAFQALGISLNTLKSNDPSAVMEVVAKRFAEMQDGATKTALANAIFGQRMGRELIPLLNQGAEGFRKATEEARAFGLVVSTQTARQAEEFNDNLKRLGSIPQGIANEIAAKVLPALVEISNRMVQWAKDNNVVKGTADVLLRSIAFLVDNIKLLATVMAAFLAVKTALFFLQLAVTVYELSKALYAAATAAGVLNLVFSKNLLVTIATFAATVLYATGVLDPLIAKAKEFGSAVLGALPENITEKIRAGLESINVNTRALTGNLAGIETHGDGAAKALSNLKPPPAFDPNAAAAGQKFSDELLKISLRAKEIRGDFDQLAPGFIAAATHLKLIKETGDGFSGTLDTLSPKMIMLNDALYKLAGANITAANLSPWQEFVKQMNLVDEAFKRNAISAETMQAASLNAAAKMIDAYGSAAAGAAGNFAEFFKVFGKGNKEMFLISKAFSISQAIINTFVGATKALASLPPPFGAIAAAGVVAAGLAMVAKIVAEKPPTAATGGTFQVAGSGSVDSQMVPIMMTPGEKVHVDQNKYGESSGSGGKIITVAGIKPKDYYTGDVLRDIMDNINTAIGDGYKIKVA